MILHRLNALCVIALFSVCAFADVPVIVPQNSDSVYVGVLKWKRQSNFEIEKNRSEQFLHGFYFKFERNKWSALKVEQNHLPDSRPAPVKTVFILTGEFLDKKLRIEHLNEGLPSIPEEIKSALAKSPDPEPVLLTLSRTRTDNNVIWKASSELLLSASDQVLQYAEKMIAECSSPKLKPKAGSAVKPRCRVSKILAPEKGKRFLAEVTPIFTGNEVGGNDDSEQLRRAWIFRGEQDQLHLFSGKNLTLVGVSDFSGRGIGEAIFDAGCSDGDGCYFDLFDFNDSFKRVEASTDGL